MAIGRVGALCLLALNAPGRAAAGQAPVHGTVVAAETGAPVVGALVAARRANRSVSTDQLGRFRLWLAAFPDTLVITFIGRAPATLAVERAPAAPLELRLEPSPVFLSAIVVTADGSSNDVGSLGKWRLSLDEARGLPAAIETDVFRALALSPAVSFTSPFSARPLVRGYDADVSSMRIDGHEVFNLYHLGRIFSAFPADALQHVSVTTAPARVTEGGTLSGSVDIVGQSGSLDDTRGGADLSLASAAAWVGGGGEGARWFGAARAVHLGLIAGLLVGQPSPYDVQDVYGSLVLGNAARPRGRLTVFTSRDDLDTDAESMSWNNVLLGSRWQLLDRPGLGVSQSVAVTHFAQDAPEVNTRSTTIAAQNRLARIGTGLEATIQRPRFRITLGANGGRRAMSNVITPLRSGDDAILRDVETSQLELGAFAEWSQTVGPATVQLGLRLDAAGPAHALQPRGRLQVPLGPALSLSAGVGRTAQLQHMVSDPRSEPNLIFYDFWLSASDSGIPVSIADHVVAEMDFRRGAWSSRVSLFASRAHGLVEVQPGADPRRTEWGRFRVGRGRTHGLEMQVSIGGTATRGSSVSVAYVLSASERDWGAGWVPWSQDRRHLLRVLTQLRLSRRWAFFGAFEGQSGVPLTPVDQLGPFGYIFGRENSIRSAGTARIDFGARYLFGGPWGSRAALGFSVLNVAFGPVAPLVLPDGYEVVFVGDRKTHRITNAYRIAWERGILLPPIPTLTLRVEF